MRITTKGQVTIPQPIREKLGISPAVEVDFVEEKGRVYLVSERKRSFCKSAMTIISLPRDHFKIRGWVFA